MSHTYIHIHTQTDIHDWCAESTQNDHNGCESTPEGRHAFGVKEIVRHAYGRWLSTEA